MRLIERLRLSECAVCYYAVKKVNKKLTCEWDAPKKYSNCDTIKDCGNFPKWFEELN